MSARATTDRLFSRTEASISAASFAVGGFIFSNLAFRFDILTQASDNSLYPPNADVIAGNAAECCLAQATEYTGARLPASETVSTWQLEPTGWL
jgi:hypothetical protein